MREAVTIEKLVSGGWGLARTDSGVVMVDGVIEGELVEIRIAGAKGRLPFARPVQILDASPFRRSVPCPHAATCGGCDWQHIAYEEQVRAKKGILQDCLVRIGKLTRLPDIETVASPEWHYRLRAQIAVSQDTHALGFYMRGTNSVARIESCALLVEPLNRLLKNQDALCGSIERSAGQIKAIAGADGAVASQPVIGGVTAAEVCIETAGAQFCVAGDSFFQGNSFLLEALGTWVRDHTGADFFVDLFGGAGFFSVFLAPKFEGGVLVDSDFDLVRRARRNFSLNGITTVSGRAGSAETFVESEASKLPRPDCVLVDPPRPGLSRRLRDGLAQLKPRTLVYVSCNPSTQARDVSALIKSCGYAIRRAAVFDLYPQSHHVETILLLERRD